MSVSLYTHTGWHTAESGVQEGLFEPENAPQSSQAHNDLIKNGYYPVYGIKTGFYHVSLGLTGNFSKYSKISLVVRGCFEIIGIGCVCLVPDALVSAHRSIF